MSFIARMFHRWMSGSEYASTTELASLSTHGRRRISGPDKTGWLRQLNIFGEESGPTRAGMNSILSCQRSLAVLLLRQSVDPVDAGKSGLPVTSLTTRDRVSPYRCCAGDSFTTPRPVFTPGFIRNLHPTRKITALRGSRSPLPRRLLRENSTPHQVMSVRSDRRRRRRRPITRVKFLENKVAVPIASPDASSNRYGCFGTGRNQPPHVGDDKPCKILPVRLAAHTEESISTNPTCNDSIR